MSRAGAQPRSGDAHRAPTAARAASALADLPHVIEDGLAWRTTLELLAAADEADAAGDRLAATSHLAAPRVGDLDDPKAPEAA